VVQVDLDHDASAQQRAEERGERLKALEEPAIGLRFMANPQAHFGGVASQRQFPWGMMIDQWILGVAYF
jgi:hypothetical protein